MNNQRGTALVWLGRPITVAAIVLLIVNDHVLKAAYPGWLTGKLSDAAGMMLAPPLLATLVGFVAPRLGHRRVALGAIVAVGTGFAIIKTIPYAAELASAGWSLFTPSLVRADATDLLALPFLMVAWWSAGEAGRSVATSPTTVARAALAQTAPAPTAPARAGRAWAAARWAAVAGRQWPARPIVARAGHVVRLTVLMPAALLGVAATTALQSADAERVWVADGAIYLEADRAWAVSRDGGRTWVAEPTRTRSATPRPSGTAAPGHALEACSKDSPATCYRVVPHTLAVQSRVGDGAWTVSWEIGETQRRALYRAYGDEQAITNLTSRAVAVQDIAGGHVVVVANGRDGFALRDTGGVWHRIGFPAMPDSGAGAPYDLDAADHVVNPGTKVFAFVLAVLLIGLILTVSGTASVVAAGGRGGWGTAVLPLLVLGVPMVFMAWLWHWEPTTILAPASWLTMPGIVVLSLACAVPVLVTAGRRSGWRATWAWWMVLTGLLAVAGQVVAYVIWVQTGTSRTWVLPVAALVACAPSVAGSIGAGRAARSATVPRMSR